MRKSVLAGFFGITEGGSSYPAVLNDGNTVALYNSQLLSTITKDGSNYVSRWNDSLGSGHDLLQATGTKQPLYSASGITFDGIDNVMKCTSFTFVKPAMIYFVGKQISYTFPDHLFDGNAIYGFTVYQNTTTPSIALYCGTSDVINTGMTLNTTVILRALSNGVGSFLRINNGVAATGNAGANNPGGFTLGAAGTATTRFSNIKVTDIILRKVADNASTQQAIYNYLASKNNLPTI